MTLDLTGLTEKRNREGTKYYEDAQGEIVAKECTKCGKFLNLLEFCKKKRGFCGVAPQCKGCQRVYNVNRYSKNKDKESELNRKYYEENRDRILKIRHSHYVKNKDNPEFKRKEANRGRKYRSKNKEKIKLSARIWREGNLDLRRLYERKRAARKASLLDTLTKDQQTEKLENFGNKCALTVSKEYHMDHVIPITTGHGGTLYENMIPLRADLNISKSNRNLFEWFADNRERFDLSQAKFDELIEYLADTNEMTTKEYRDFVYWCHDNPRTVEEIEADNERYGYKKPSSEIWREEVTNKGRELVEA